MIPNGAIALVKDIALTGDALQIWSTDWVSFPAGIQTAQLFIEVRAIDAGKSATLWLMTAYDPGGAFEAFAYSPPPVAAVGLVQFTITTGLGQLVRLRLRTDVNGTFIVLSAWLMPKRN